MGQKKESLTTKKLFISFSYYKLRAGEHFVHYVFGLGSEGYGVGGVREIIMFHNIVATMLGLAKFLTV